MKLVTIEQAREHARTDGDDDELLTVYVDAAEATCERLANRGLFLTQEEFAEALSTIEAEITDAWTAYQTMMDSITAPAGVRYDATVARAVQMRDHQLHKINWKARGIVATPDIITAVLALAAHYYRNREEVASGQGASSVRVPMMAESIMYHHRYMGD